MASIITPWIDILAGQLKKGDCSLSMTDSSTSEGWSKHTEFKEDVEEPTQAEFRKDVASTLTSLFMGYEIKDYSQWFRGDNNNFSDALSRDNENDDETLTNILHGTNPFQLP